MTETTNNKNNTTSTASLLTAFCKPAITHLVWNEDGEAKKLAYQACTAVISAFPDDAESILIKSNKVIINIYAAKICSIDRIFNKPIDFINALETAVDEYLTKQ